MDRLGTIRRRDAEIDFSDLARRFSAATQFNAGIKSPRIAVIGDFCLDKYLYLFPSLNEVSVETGLVARQVRATRLYAGVGGTIANNLRALGAETFCFGVVGEDGEGFDLVNALRKIGADVEGVVASNEVLTPTYMKPMSPAESPTGVPIDSPAPERGEWIESERIDIRGTRPAPAKAVEEVERRFLERVDSFDAAIVSDQFQPGSETLFSASFRQFICDCAEARPDKFFLCDSRFFVDSYRNVMVKCNANELLDARDVATSGERRRETNLERDAEGDLPGLASIAADFAERNGRPILVTRGAHGSLCVGYDEPTRTYEAVVVPANPVSPPIDVCGAGDATNAGLAFARSLGFSIVESSYLAGVASSITIRQIGTTGVATTREILDVLLRNAAR